MTSRIAAMVLLAALIRAPGLFTDFWLDEIWSLSNVAGLDSPAGVFTAIHHDSNHWLVSLWLYAVGRSAPFWLYRLPSLLAGIAAVVVAGSLARFEGSTPTLAMLFTATSFSLGFYSSEARGYSLAALAGLVAILALSRWAEGRRRAWLATYAVASSLGILAHLSFLIVLAAAIAYSLILLGLGMLSVRRLILAHAAPVAVLAGLVVVDLRYVTIGGAPRIPPGEVLAQTASLSVGGPMEFPVAWLSALFALLLLLASLRKRFHERPPLWLFYVAVLGIPVWLAFALDPPFLFPRYFLVSVAFVPAVVASLAASLPRVYSACLIAAWLGLNGFSWIRFAEEGRGNYEQALHEALARFQNIPLVLGGDQDFRDGMVLDFYRERMGEAGKRIEYLDRENWPPRGVDGFIQSYPLHTPSGFRWVIYPNAPR